METKKELLNDLKIVNYKKHRGHDGDGFNLEFIYKGKKIIHVHDDAWGGEFDYTFINHTDEKAKALFKELQDRVKKLPPYTFRDTKMNYCLDTIVSELCRKKDLEKDMKKGVLIKTAFGWAIHGYNVSIPTLLKKYRDGLKCLQEVYDDKKRDGHEILNTEYLASVGVKL